MMIFCRLLSINYVWYQDASCSFTKDGHLSIEVSVFFEHLFLADHCLSYYVHLQ